MRIIESGNTRAIEHLFAKKEAPDRAFERQVAAIVQNVRRGGDRALRLCAKRFDDLTPPIEVSREEMAAEAARVPADVRAAIKHAARNIARVAARQIPKHFDRRRWCRRVGRTARRAAGTRRLLRAGRTLPAALVAADDRRSGARRRRARDHRRLPAAGAGA